jgi:hypothetical protein
VPRLEPRQTAFNAGEVSPRLRGHVGSDLYKRGLGYCENWIPTPQGSLLTRGGFESIYKLPDKPTVRLIPFHSSALLDYLLVLTDLELRAFVLTGILETGGTDLITNGTFSVGTGWTFVDGIEGGSAGISGGKLWLDSDRVIVEVKPFVYEYWWGSAYQEFAVGSAGERTLTFDCTIPVGASLSVVVHSATGDKLSVEVTSSGTKQYSVVLAAETTRITFEGTGDVVATIYVDNVTLIGGASAPSPLVTAWTEAMLDDLQYVHQPGKDSMVLTHQAVDVKFITLTGGAFSTGNVVFTSKPSSWTGSNWPRACEFHQGRLLLAGTPSDPNTFWASKAGTPENFTTGTNPEDAFSRDLQTAGAILWMRSASRLLFGTDVGETVVYSQGPILRESDVGALTQSHYGSVPVQALRVGGVVAFVTADRRRVRGAEYDQQTETVLAKDLTFQAEHITEDVIKEIHWARNPDGLLLLVMRSGKLIACTFSREEGVLAWWRITTEGSVKSAAVTETSTGSVLWAAVQRLNGMFLERMILNDRLHVRLDAQVTRAIDPVTFEIADLDDLIGETVDVFVDGDLVVESTVVPGTGIITLTEETSGTEAVVGIRFTATARTLPKTQALALVRSPRVGLLLNDSAIPTVNGWRAEERDPATAWDVPTERRSGEVVVGQSGGYDREGVLEIVQDGPFRTEVLSIFEITSVGKV